MASLELEQKIIKIEPPTNLNRKKMVETNLGTWSMQGDTPILDYAVFGIAKPDNTNIPKISDINDYTASLLEEQTKPTENQTPRRNRIIKKLTVGLLTTFLS